MIYTMPFLFPFSLKQQRQSCSKSLLNNTQSNAKLRRVDLFSVPASAMFGKRPPSDHLSVLEEDFLPCSKVRKRPGWRKARCRLCLPHTTHASGRAAKLLSWKPPLFQPSLAGSDRRVKPCGQLELRGLTLPRLLLF